MSQINVLLTHQDAAAVDANVAYLRSLAPDARFVVAHGGRRADYEGVTHPEKVFVDDPTLRGAPRTFQSYHVVLAELHRTVFAQDPDAGALYLFEWDHVVLRADFEARLTELATRMGADFMGKTCVERTGTNWHHYTRFRRDPALLAHLRGLSVREHPERLYGTLGNGFWMTRAALAAYVAVEDPPPVYGELYVPTVLHHLGFRVADIDATGDLYRHVHYEPELSLADVVAIKRAGGVFAHPFKGEGAWGQILAAGAP
jgi:hypothetical protein